jgi:oxysterol-binding protein 1
LTLINNVTGEQEVVWTKNPYPDTWEYQYGFGLHQIQFNHLPESLKPKLPPTDARFRPDLKALESGDFKLAAVEKNRLEEKQRSVRRFNEKHHIVPKPFFFDEWTNPEDPEQTYYRYNERYFEKERPETDWRRLPDLFSEKLPPEVE